MTFMTRLFSIATLMVSLMTQESQAKKASDGQLHMQLKSGEVVIRLRPDLAPQHVAQIVALTQEGFYDDIIFHRVIPGFMAQTGDPTGTGMGGSKRPNVPAEFSKAPHVRGAVSMARSQNPNSGNSQFFIVFDKANFLDGQYTVWGEVIQGMEHVDAVAKGEPPRNPDKIIKMTYVPGK